MVVFGLKEGIIYVNNSLFCLEEVMRDWRGNAWHVVAGVGWGYGVVLREGRPPQLVKYS